VTRGAVPLRRSQRRQRQIIRRCTSRRGANRASRGLLSAWRTNEPEFVLTRSRSTGRRSSSPVPTSARVITRTRVWALVDYGFKAVISLVSGHLRGNSLKAGR